MEERRKDHRNVTMTEDTDVDMPTTTGGPTSGNVNNAHVSTTPSRTETSAPTARKYKGRYQLACCKIQVVILQGYKDTTLKWIQQTC